MKNKIILSLIVAITIFSCDMNKEVVDISISNRRIELGDTVKVNWNISGKKIENINMVGIKDSLKKKGGMQFSPDETIKLRFEIERKKDSPIKKTYRVEVLPPKINYFRGPTLVTDEQYFNVRWGVENVKYVEIVGIRDWLGKQGQLKVRLDSTMDLTLKVTNKFGRVAKKTLPIEVTVLEDFDAPDEIYIGDKAQVRWKYKLADYVQIVGSDTKYNAADTLIFTPENDTTLTFNIKTKRGDIRTEKHKIKVLPPDILYFSAPKTVNLGGEAKLTWNVKGAKSIRIEGIDEELPARNKLVVTPTRSKTYTLTIKRDDFEKSKYARVNVIRSRKYVDGVAALGSLSSGERIDMEIFDVDYSNFPNKVTFKALAVDSKGNFVTGLGKNSSTYFKNIVETVKGKKHTRSGFGVVEKHNKVQTPFDIALALDYTGSLQDAIGTLESGVKLFISKKHDDDQMAIIKFNDTIVTQVKLTKNKYALLQNGGFNGKINQDGNTALYAGADQAVNELKDAANQRTIVLFTDGHENSSFVFYNDRAVTASDLIKNARENNVKIHVVAFGDEVNNNLLKRIAQLTGGNIYELNTPKNIEAVFKELPYIFRNYYEITYKPVDKDGVHKISMTYNNLQSSTQKAESEFFIGDKFDISNYEYVEGTYWSDYCTKELRPLSAPQAATFFHFDKSELDATYKTVLKKYAEYLTQNKDIQIVLFGHTDLKGSKSYCLDLSRRRGEMVKKYLVENGVASNRFKIVARGQENPVWQSEEFEWQERENRRIEILLLTKEQ